VHRRHSRMQSAPAFRIFRAGLPQKERDYRNEKKEQPPACVCVSSFHHLQSPGE